MTLDDLIEKLTDIRDDVGGDADVRLAHQPQWAFEYSIGDVAPVALVDDEDEEKVIEEKVIVYISEGNQIGYLPGEASRVLGWRR